MSKHYELLRSETLEEAFRRIADHQLTIAEATLTDSAIPAERRIHETRKRFKESRALVRLFRHSLGSEFRIQNLWYRDVGRLLAVHRDAAAVVEAVEKLPREVQTEIGAEATEGLTQMLRERSLKLYADADGLERNVTEVMTRIVAMRIRLSELPLHVGEKGQEVERGLAGIAAEGRREWLAAYETPSDEGFHQWRKRVKDQWYHAQLFAPVWPELLAVREKALDELAHLLGDHHDLAVVRELFIDAGEQFGLASEGDRIPRVIAARQEALTTAAFPIAQHIYATRARDQAREMIALWRSWRVVATDPAREGARQEA